MILRLAISVEHRLMIDKQIGRHTTMAYAYTVLASLAWRCTVKTARCAIIAMIVLWYRPTLHFTTNGALSPLCSPVGVFGVVCAGSECVFCCLKDIVWCIAQLAVT